jgi:hypothetical protein
MEEMYSLGLKIHDYGVWFLVGVIVLNTIMLNLSQDIYKYAKRMRIFMPISASLIFLVLFTGMVMMAAKHLSFSIENIVMIILIVAMMFFESKRYASLKHLNLDTEDPFKTYKVKANKILFTELSSIVAMSIWMYLL